MVEYVQLIDWRPNDSR